MTAAASPVL
jgi:transposase